MGQYYLVVNLDKRQYLHPHDCLDGMKLMEFAGGNCGTMACLVVLLADGNGRGGGDLDSDDPLIGSWAGDRIVVAGDYADDGKFLQGEFAGNLFHAAEDNYENISLRAMTCVARDSYYRGIILKEVKRSMGWSIGAKKLRDRIAAG